MLSVRKLKRYQFIVIIDCLSFIDVALMLRFSSTDRYRVKNTYSFGEVCQNFNLILTYANPLRQSHLRIRNTLTFTIAID